MKNFLAWLDGKKTYICTLFCAAALLAKLKGWIDPQVADVLITGFGAGTVFALRSGVNKK